MAHPTAPDPTSLLPPLLACLPAAFATPEPPAAVLPLLSPILRQRLQLLSSTSTNDPQPWLSLLCWDSSQATKLASLVQSEGFEPHPVSGEIELGAVTDAEYRRLDEETVQSRLRLSDLGLMVTYVWCEDAEGGKDGWRVAELASMEGPPSGVLWHGSMASADEAAAERRKMQNEPKAYDHDHGSSSEAVLSKEQAEDDYWAQYGHETSTTTPMEGSSIPTAPLGRESQASPTSEEQYYEQYAHVQPEMDNDDPHGDRSAVRESTVGGNVILDRLIQMVPPGRDEAGPSEHARTGAMSETGHSTSSTRPLFPDSRIPRSGQHIAHASTTALAVQQHLSSSLKSLASLARGSGVKRAEIEKLVALELDAVYSTEED